MAFWSTLGSFMPVISQAASGIMQAQAGLQQGKMDHALANYNAEVDELASSRIMEKGYRDESTLRRSFDQFRGGQKAAIGKSGVAFSGSVMDVLAESATNAELDAMNTRFNALTEAAGRFKDAEISRATGDVVRSNSRQSATGQLINTAGNVFQTGRRLKLW